MVEGAEVAVDEEGRWGGGAAAVDDWVGVVEEDRRD